jgi:hypothetical protein
MLIGIQLAVFAQLGEASCFLGYLKFYKRPSPASNKKATVFYDAAYVFNGLKYCFSNTVHWVFAMKYWSVAKKLQLLES